MGIGRKADELPFVTTPSGNDGVLLGRPDGIRRQKYSDFVSRLITDALESGPFVEAYDESVAEAVSIATSAAEEARAGAEEARDAATLGPLGEEWNAAVSYEAGKRVEHSGALWYAVVDNINIEPGSDAAVWGPAWSQFAGGILTEKLTTAASTVDRAGLALPAGSAPTTPVNGDIWRVGTSVFIRYGAATGKMTANLDPSSWPSSMALALRVASVNAWASFTSAAVIPLDDTIPASTEGSQIMTGSFTPRAATHRYKVKATVPVYVPGAAVLVFAIFNGTSCIGVSVETFTAAEFRLVTVESQGVRVVPGTTAQTISVRAGNSAGGGAAFHVNGNAAGRLFGGFMAASIDVLEDVA